MRIGIVGNGYVGKATALLKCLDVNVVIYDKDPDKCMPVGISLSMLKDCDFIFVCVPTPMRQDGKCDASIVQSVVTDLVSIGYSRSHIIVRSTVPIGTCMDMGVMFFPEFLTERNWKNDFRNNNVWILGRDESNISRSIVDELYDSVFMSAHHHGCLKNIPRVDYYTTQEAELAKYIRNCFLAVKVSFFNEMEELCVKKGIDYNAVREAVGVDQRIGLSHTAVPGPDGRRGYGGTCFPKDTAALLYQMNEQSLVGYVLGSACHRNNTIDRKEQDWRSDKGRAVV
tara:strand:+ start:289 stop:1140 length:852 start_codon:yes stop_codon:yes gene_type:complete